MNAFTQHDWDAYAQHYDCLNHLTPYQELQRTVAQEMLSFPGRNILNAACGTGNLEQELCWSAAKKPMAVYGIDSSKEMILRAKEKKLFGLHVHFSHLSLEGRLPFAHDTFDQVASINTLYAVKDPEKVLREFSRLIAPGGFLFLVTPKENYQNGLILKKHCRSEKPDHYWVDAHHSLEREELLIREAINDVDIQEEMIAVARFNRQISKTASFHFFSEQVLTSLVEQNGFHIFCCRPIYADQGLFLVAQKGSVLCS